MNMYEEALRRVLRAVVGIDDDTLFWLLSYARSFLDSNEAALPRDFVEYLNDDLDYMVAQRIYDEQA